MSLEKLGDFYKSANNETTSGITGNGTSSPLGVDEDSYSVYNEKCLFSSVYSCQTGALSDDFTKYQRLRLRVGWHNNSTTTNEGDSYIEVTPEPTAGANVAAIWNVGTGTPGYICVGRINFPTTTSFNGTVGKLMQFDGNAGNTGWEGKLRPIKEVWGINKQLYKFFALSSEGGSLESNKLLGYRGDTATLTAIPASEDWKCSAIDITGATLTGNDFMFENSNVTASAGFEHSRELTLENGDHGVLSADKMTGFSGDVVTVDATTDEGWYLSAIDLTGAEATGFKFMFTGSDVTALGKYTDVGFPITYLSDEHVSLTGDQIYIPGQSGITLDSGYDTYYRISGYDITGGSIVDGKLVPTGPCTIKAVEKVNAFTARGNFNLYSKGTYILESNKGATAISYAHYTGGTNVPTSYYNVSLTSTDNGGTSVKANGWNPGSNISAYKFSGQTIASTYVERVNTRVQCSLQVGSTNFGNKYDATYRNATNAINNTGTTTTIGKIRRYLTVNDAGNSRHYMTDITNASTNTWTATGIAP